MDYLKKNLVNLLKKIFSNEKFKHCYSICYQTLRSKSDTSIWEFNQGQLNLSTCMYIQLQNHLCVSINFAYKRYLAKTARIYHRQFLCSSQKLPT